MAHNANSAFAQFHFATRNSSALRSMHAAHRIHYRADVIAAVVESVEATCGGLRVQIPPPLPLGDATLLAVLEKRASMRDWRNASISVAVISTLLKYALGFRDLSAAKRYVPSSGNLGCVTAHVIALDIDGIAPGIYTHDPVGHELILVSHGEYREWIRRHVCFQSEFGEAAAVFVLEANVGRLQAKYGERAYRLALMDVGHVSENLYLLSAALGIGACATAGFFERDVEIALGVDGTSRMALLLLGVGGI